MKQHHEKHKDAMDTDSNHLGNKRTLQNLTVKKEDKQPQRIPYSTKNVHLNKQVILTVCYNCKEAYAVSSTKCLTLLLYLQSTYLTISRSQPP